MAWAPPYSLTNPTTNTSRAVGETEVQKVTKIKTFIDDATPEITAARAHVAATSGTIHGVVGPLVGNGDARLSDTRVPTDNSVTTAKIAAGAVTDAKVTGPLGVSKIGSGTPGLGKYVDGQTGAWTTLPAVAASKGPAMFTIAALDSPTVIKNRADLVAGAGNSANVAAEINAFVTDVNNQLGARYCGIQMAPGTYDLEQAILVPSRGFTVKGNGQLTQLMARSTIAANGEGADKACIKLATGLTARNANGVVIEDLYISGYGANTTPGHGIYLVYTASADTGFSSVGSYGEPHAATSGDTYHRIKGVTIVDTRYGLRIEGGSAYSRANHISDVIVQNYRYSGFYINNSSDNLLWGCKSATSYNDADTSYGFYLGGGNTRVLDSKASYVGKGASDVGFFITSSRCMLGNVESQDCAIGVEVASGSEALLNGVRIDTQVQGGGPNAQGWYSTCGLRINAAGVMGRGIYVQTRSPGAWPIGIDFQNTSDHSIDAVINQYRDTAVGDPTPFNAVTIPIKNGASTVTTSAGLPSNGDYRILVTGSTAANNRLFTKTATAA